MINGKTAKERWLDGDSAPQEASKAVPVADELRIAIDAFKALRDSLLPAFEMRGVSLRVSQEDHEAIRSALAGASTGIHLLESLAHPSQPEPTSKAEACQKCFSPDECKVRGCADEAIAVVEQHNQGRWFSCLATPGQDAPPIGTKLYAASQQRALSDEEIQKVWYDCGLGKEWDIPACEDHLRFARAIQAAVVKGGE